MPMLLGAGLVAFGGYSFFRFRNKGKQEISINGMQLEVKSRSSG
jgi:hypothetical protein